MNLDGKLIGGEKKFHQERKFVRRGAGREIGATPFERHFLPRLM